MVIHITWRLEDIMPLYGDTALLSKIPKVTIFSSLVEYFVCTTMPLIQTLVFMELQNRTTSTQVMFPGPALATLFRMSLGCKAQDSAWAVARMRNSSSSHGRIAEQEQLQ